MITGIDHIAIAVTSLHEGRAAFEKLGLHFETEEEVPSQKVRVALCRLGAVTIELLEPTDPASPIQGFLEKRGPGLHHLALRTDGILADLERGKANGLRLLQETPSPGAHGAQIAFLHPSSTGRVLLELCERSDGVS